MISKINLVIIVFAVILVAEAMARSTINGEQKKVRCFKPSKPQDMPQDIYDKYHISSKDLTEQDKKDLWQKFVEWWKNVFGLLIKLFPILTFSLTEKIGQFFQKVGQFFKNLFTTVKNKEQSQTTSQSTEPPPTPDPGRAKASEGVVCVEYDDTNDSTDQTKETVTESPVSTLMTTIVDSTTEVTTTDSAKLPESTPYDPNGERKEKIPVVIGMEEKANLKKHHDDATVVRDV